MDEKYNIKKKRKLETKTIMEDIFVLPFFGQGHLFPAMELCRNISSHNYNVTLIIPSHLSSSIPTSFTNQLIHVTEISVSVLLLETGSGRRGHPLEGQNKQMGEGIKMMLSRRNGVRRPSCVVIDVMMSWSKELFVDHEIPVVAFSTSGATASAMGYGRWKASIGDVKRGESREIPGLPKELAVTFTDLNNGRRGRPQGGHARPDGIVGPPNRMRFDSPNGLIGGPGSKPRWVDEVNGSIALLINTCDNLERLFIGYISEQIKLPIWGVGPLLPTQFWKATGSLLHDSEMRSNHKSNYAEDEVIEWLESKPIGSVIYISFGSEVGPTIDEYKELAKVLEVSDHAFIWVIQPGSGKSSMPRSFLGPAHTDSEEEEEGYYPKGLDIKVGNRGLIITGWAPQLLILSHPSTRGFLSHCGWNSTLEAIGLGVPILGWPINGDQFDNAKLVSNHLKIGLSMLNVVNDNERQGKFNKDAIAEGIERLMTDENVHKQAKKLSKEFESGFPVSSVKAMGEFVEFISQKAV